MTEKATAAVLIPSRLTDSQRSATAPSWRKDRGPRANKRWIEIRRRFELLRSHLDERARRCWAGAEAIAYGRGGIAVVAEAAAMSPHTVTAGVREVREARPLATGQAIRRAGAGRKRLKDNDPDLIATLEALVEPPADGATLLGWTSKSLRRLSDELRERGHHAGADVVGDLLRDLGYRLRPKANRTRTHPEPSLQFGHIVALATRFLQAVQPVISIDVRAKQSVGPDHGVTLVDRNAPGCPESESNGLIELDTDDDTARFAVDTIERWWREVGRTAFPQTPQLLLTTDADGAIGSGGPVWRAHLQRFADESCLRVVVCHFPPATRKWRQVAHRMLVRDTLMSSSGALLHREATVTLITNPSAAPKPIDLTRPPQRAAPKLEGAANVSRLHRGWNYTVRPRPRPD